MERIAMGLPGETMLMHERSVTRTLHTVIAESKLGLYKCRHWNTAALRQQRSKRNREPIPDLLLELTTRSGRIIILNLEVDMGTRPAHVVARQLRKQAEQDQTIVVLCVTAGRIDGLKDACIRVDSIRMRHIYFAMLENFWEHALKGVTLLTTYGEERRLKLD